MGDFGLACYLQHCSDDVTMMMQPSSEHPPKHRGEIGTKLYAAPEQLRGKCDSKVSELLSSFHLARIEIFMHLGHDDTFQEVSIRMGHGHW